MRITRLVPLNDVNYEVSTLMESNKLPIHCLIVDDDEASAEGLASLLERENMRAVYFNYPMQAIDYASTHQNIDIAFIDLRMPSIDGIEVLKQIKSRRTDTICVLMSGYGTVDSAVEAMRYGAYDFLLKPIRKNYLSAVLQKIVEKISLSRELAQLRGRITRQATARLIGQSPIMNELRKRVITIAKSNATVLILGESGTGKELVVDALHEGSDRKNKPLVKINCTAIPPDLVEAELFGFERGAFTGANHTKVGHFENADGGTLFLDEIGELPPSVQVKILRVLQDHTVQRIGSHQTKKVNVRIVSATNQDLYQLINEGRFREDLFYRLNVVPIHIPPLRERTEDIPLLIRFYLDHYCQKHGKKDTWFTSGALSLLIQYAWPGNVRELLHLCEQLVLTCDGHWLTENDLPPHIASAPKKDMNIPIKIGTTLKEATTILMKEAMMRAGGDIDKAAATLNIHPKTIRRRMQEIEPDPAFENAAPPPPRVSPPKS